MLLANYSGKGIKVVYVLREIKNAARSVKEVIQDYVKYLHVDSSHIFGRKSENHFKVLLSCFLEQSILEQEVALVHTLNAVNSLSFFTYLSKGTNSYLQSELLFATRQHFSNNTTGGHFTKTV